MTIQEMRELDAWIVEYVMRLKPCPRIPAVLNQDEFVLSIPSKIVRARIGCRPCADFSPTSAPADALEVLKKCEPLCDRILINKTNNEWNVWHDDGRYNLEARAETIEIAICQFARKLFTK